MRILTGKTLLACISVLITIPVFGSACLNPCTGSALSGQDATDRNNFNLDNSSLIFSNITFNDATGTYDASTTGLNSSTNSSAQLYGLSFIGCLSSGSPCVSNSNGGVTVGSLGSWNGGADPVLTNGQIGTNGSNSATLTIALPSASNILAIGFDVLFGKSVIAPTQFGVILDNGTTQGFMTTTGVNLPGSVFFGYTSATAITSLTVYAQNTIVTQSTLGLDNLEIGTIG